MVAGSMPKRVVDRGQQLAGMDRVGQRGRAGLVGLAVDVAAANAGAGEDGRVAVRPVVAAVGAVAVARGADALLRAAAELADGDDQRLVQAARARPCRSSRPESPWSSIGPDRSRIRLVRSAWWSHEWLSELATLGQMTSTTFVPASTRRRASRQLWPNVLRP